MHRDGSKVQHDPPNSLGKFDNLVDAGVYLQRLGETFGWIEVLNYDDQDRANGMSPFYQMIDDDPADPDRLVPLDTCPVPCDAEGKPLNEPDGDDDGDDGEPAVAGAIEPGDEEPENIRTFAEDVEEEDDEEEGEDEELEEEELEEL
jgi:hypothetical protein